MITEIKDGGAAFPRDTYSGVEGMSLRDWFAGMALVGLTHEADVFWAGAALLAYQYADAMLEARKKAGA